MHAKAKPNRLLAAESETRGQEQILKEIAGMVSERGQMQGRGTELAEVLRLLSQRSLAKWLSFLEELSDKDCPAMEDLYSTLTFVTL